MRVSSTSICTPSTVASVESSPGVGGAADDVEEVESETQLVVFQAPSWLAEFLAGTGIATLQYKIQLERNKRMDEFYTNPYPITATMVESNYFDFCVGSVTILNCAILGWEVSLDEGDPAENIFFVLEVVFSLLFLVEWCMRLVVYGWIWPYEFANAVDTFLVFGTGIFLRPLTILGIDNSGLRIFTALRIFRLARTARVFRLYPGFTEMWVLLNGLMTSARPLTWVTVIAVVVLYIFAVAATELVGRNPDYADHEAGQELFGDLAKSMFTMVQLMTLDKWCDEIARPVMGPQPFVLSVFFISFIGIGVFVFWNLITAVVVDSARRIYEQDDQQQAKDLEEAKKRDLSALKDLFLEIDTDKSGCLDKAEFFGQLKNKRMKRTLDLLEMKEADMEYVWEILDDGDGTLSIREFTDGVRRMKGDAKAKDIHDCIKRLGHTKAKQLLLKTKVQKFVNTIREIDIMASRVKDDTEDVMSLFLEMYHRLDAQIQKGSNKTKKGVVTQDFKGARLPAKFHDYSAKQEEEERKKEELQAQHCLPGGNPGELVE